MPALSVPSVLYVLSVLLPLLSLPPPFSSSCGMPRHPPPYILLAQWRWQRHLRDARQASARPSNHRHCERAGGRRRGGQLRAINGGGSGNSRHACRHHPP